MMRNKSIKVILAIFIIVGIIYVRHYYNYPSERLVMQTSLETFNFDHLLARQPLVIQDKVPNVSQLVDMWFPRNNTKLYATPDNVWIKTSHKYSLLFHPTEKMEILVLHAGGRTVENNAPHPEETLTAIELEANQILVLPFHTVFLVNKEKSTFFAVHDWVTRFLP